METLCKNMKNKKKILNKIQYFENDLIKNTEK